MKFDVRKKRQRNQWVLRRNVNLMPRLHLIFLRRRGFRLFASYLSVNKEITTKKVEIATLPHLDGKVTPG